jgi:hypothetical protein
MQSDELSSPCNFSIHGYWVQCCSGKQSVSSNLYQRVSQSTMQILVATIGKCHVIKELEIKRWPAMCDSPFYASDKELS